MNITVYLGANPGNDPKYTELAQAVGTWIGENQHTLIYGGSERGLMGIISRACLEAGGAVHGIMSEDLKGIEKVANYLTDLKMVENIMLRKELLIAKADLCVALPGGSGTLEEIVDTISGRRTKAHDKPCVIYNLDGYYDHLRAHYYQIAEAGFIEKEFVEAIPFIDNLDELAVEINSLR